ncbi:MAG: GFA family protein [Gammaproteobacteria bacterium]|nr:GFA family protein [Gammaproteobacteria bacterium]
MAERRERGACFCGAIVAQMTGEPFCVCYDHDEDCRRATGGALVVWVGYRPEQLIITAGKLKTFSRTRGVVRTFCSDCGSSIGYADDGTPQESYIALGFLDHPERFRPQVHAFWRERLPWIALMDDLPRIDGYSVTRHDSWGPPRDRK